MSSQSKVKAAQAFLTDCYSGKNDGKFSTEFNQTLGRGVDFLEHIALSETCSEEKAMEEIRIVTLGTLLAALGYDDGMNATHSKKYTVVDYDKLRNGLPKDAFPVTYNNNPLFLSLVRHIGVMAVNGTIEVAADELKKIVPQHAAYIDELLPNANKKIALNRKAELIHQTNLCIQLGNLFNQAVTACKFKPDQHGLAMETDVNKCKLQDAIRALGIQVISEFSLNNKKFDPVNCRIMAQATLALANKIGSGLVQTDIDDFSKTMQPFIQQKNSRFSLLIASIITITGLLLGAAVGFAFGGVVGAAIGAGVGAATGCVVGNLAANSFSMWYAKKTDPTLVLINASEQLLAAAP